MKTIMAANSSGFNEKVMPVQVFAGQNSDSPQSRIQINEFSSLINVDFNSKSPGTRQGVETFVTGMDGTVLFAYEFKASADSSAKVCYVTSKRKFYTTTTAGASLTLVSMPQTGTISYCNGVMLDDALYFVDGTYLYKYNGSTISDVTASLPALGTPVDVAKMQNRLWVLTADYIIYSVVGDPDDLTTTMDGAGSIQIDSKDGTKNKNIYEWGSTLVVSKGDESTFRYASYWVQGTGTTSDPFYYESLIGDSKSPTGFVGKSGVKIGNDLIGLTFDGVTTISAINNFQKADGDLISVQVNDVIKNINFGLVNLIQGLYESADKRYFLSFAMNGRVVSDYILVYDTTFDRWSTYQGKEVRSWFTIGRGVYFGSVNGTVYHLSDEFNDDGMSFPWSMTTGEISFGQPDVVKLFKSIELELDYSDSLILDVQFTIDGVKLDKMQIELTSPGSRWDEAYWDIDSWDGQGSEKVTIYVLARGKSIKTSISSGQLDSPLFLKGITYRYIEKDSGSAKP